MMSNKGLNSKEALDESTATNSSVTLSGIRREKEAPTDLDIEEYSTKGRNSDPPRISAAPAFRGQLCIASLNCWKKDSYFSWPPSAANRNGYTFLTQISFASGWLFKIDMTSSMNSLSGIALGSSACWSPMSVV